MDGIDAALVDFSEDQPKLIACQNTTWPLQLYTDILATHQLSDEDLTTLKPLDIKAGETFAVATNALLEEAGIESAEIIAIGSHGQTIRHKPNGPQPFSLQIGDALTIAQQTNIDVISDFRTADIKAGGEGAPLAPAFHNAVFRSSEENRIVVNIGGIANLTVLDSDSSQPVIGFDSGPGNTLMDVWTVTHQNKKYDENGYWAASGSIDENLLNTLLKDEYFAKKAPKSTGFEYFNLDWLKPHLEKNTRAEDVQATLCELTALSIANATNEYKNKARLLICGGGVHNSHLIKRLQVHLPENTIETTEPYGVNPDWVEAVAFAWLARQTMNGKPGNLPSVTGAKSAIVLGEITKA